MMFCCPYCNQQLRTPHEYAGEIAECPSCRNEVVVPSSIPSYTEKPVFLDTSNARWRWMRLAFFAVSFVFFISLVCLSISIAVNPVLPSLGLGDAGKEMERQQLPPPTAGRSVLDQGASGELRRIPVRANAREALKNKLRRPARIQGFGDKAPGKEDYRLNPDGVSTDRPLTMAFAAAWDDASLNSLRRNMDKLDVVIPEWLKLSAEGKVEPLVSRQQVEVRRILGSSLASPRLVPLLTSYDIGRGWQGEEIGTLLAAGSTRAGIITGLLEYSRNFPVYGFCINFEGIPLKLMPGYMTFLDELAKRVHAEKKVLYVCVPREIPSPVCRRMAQAADMAIVLAYSQHSGSGEPGPLAAQDWFENMIELRAVEIPRSKLGIAFGNYVCDWPGSVQGVASQTFDRAMMTAREHQSVVRMDQVSLNPAFRYRDAKGRQHDVWMLDAVSAFNQVAAAKKLRPRGIVLWRLGSEDTALWRFHGRTGLPDAQVCRALADIELNEGISYTGSGEIIRVAATPATGKRRMTFDEHRRLITACDYDTLPTPYIVQQYGASRVKVALTFDDGPDPAYTGAILDILRREHVQATFFVLGTSAELQPELLKRIDREGHEIGSHSFTHPNISKITCSQLKRELTTTQRLMESLLGHQTLLFRPPYGEDTDPTTPGELQSLEVVSGLGYWTVGMHVDPEDWRSLPADEIVRRTLEQVRTGEGNIVLLHDGGGDRGQTVAALPDIIKELHRYGYELVPVSELLGRTRAEVMPPLAGAQHLPATMNRLMFGLAGTILNSLKMLFMLGIILGLARLLFIGLLAVVDVLRKRRIYYSCNYKPSVAVIVPAYNEEKVICKTIDSLLTSKCPCPMEIIVVDDGSKDETYQRAFDAFGRNPSVRIFKKNNSGKSSALNFGLSQTKAEIVVAMDADTVFAQDTIWKLVRHFDNEGIGAVAGNAKVGNRINMLTKWQALEYITSQNLDRRAFNVLDCITVVPGAVGAWRRELVIRAGGFGQATLAEDADLTIAIRRMGYSIVNEDEAYAYTEAPDTVGGFVRQRYRWMYGTLQAAWKHKRALFNPRYGALGFVALPNIFVFQVFFPLISPAIDLLTVCTLGNYAWAMVTGAAGSTDALVMVLAYYILFTAVDFAVVMLAFALEPKEDKQLLWWIFPQRFCYRQLMYYVAIKSALAALRGMEVGWGKIKRKATVNRQ